MWIPKGSSRNYQQKIRHIAEQRVTRFSTDNSSTVRMSAITSCGTTKWMCLHTVSITMANSIVTIHKQLCLWVPSNMHAYINKEMHLNYISNIYIPKDASNIPSGILKLSWIINLWGNLPIGSVAIFHGKLFDFTRISQSHMFKQTIWVGFVSDMDPSNNHSTIHKIW